MFYAATPSHAIPACWLPLCVSRIRQREGCVEYQKDGRSWLRTIATAGAMAQSSNRQRSSDKVHPNSGSRSGTQTEHQELNMREECLVNRRQEPPQPSRRSSQMTSQVEGTSPSTVMALQQRQRERLSSPASQRSAPPDEFLGAPNALSPSPAASGSHGLPQTTSRLSRKRAPPDGSTGVLWFASPSPAQLRHTRHTAFLELRLLGQR